MGKIEALASSPTFSRLETRATRAELVKLNGVLIDHFIAGHKKAPSELVLDIDASDMPLHGEQELSQFHGYYAPKEVALGHDHYCYLPLYVFCGQAMLACLLRPSRIDGAKHAAALIKEFRYAADSWNIERRLITRLEFGAQGTNPRFVVTNLGLPADALYDQLYCQRGDAENRIKETQLDLFGTRASCHKFHANWLRLMFAALAYTLIQRLRDTALAGTELAKATASTIRVRLLKLGAAILRNTRRVRIMLASHHPLRGVFLTAAQALAP